MRKSFEIQLGQSSGEYFVTTGEPKKDYPSFFFVQRTRQAAIDAACRAIATYLQVKKTPAKGKVQVEKTQKYTAPLVEEQTPRRQNKYGGLPMKKVVPNETITLSVEV
jgi:hypothetical protein